MTISREAAATLARAILATVGEGACTSKMVAQATDMILAHVANDALRSEIERLHAIENAPVRDWD